MKLTVVFLLVTLMVCCYSDTDVKVGTPNMDIITHLFSGSMDDYMKAIAPFATSADMTEAASRLKQCVLEATEKNLLAKNKLLENILGARVKLPNLI